MEHINIYLIEIYMKIEIGANNISILENVTEINKNQQPFASGSPINLFIDNTKIPPAKLQMIEKILKLRIKNTEVTSRSSISSHNRGAWIHAVVLLTGIMGNLVDKTFTIFHMEDISHQIILKCSPKNYFTSIPASLFEQISKNKKRTDTSTTVDISDDTIIYVMGKIYYQTNPPTSHSSSTYTSELTQYGCKPIAVIFNITEKTHKMLDPLIQALKEINIKTFINKSTNPKTNNETLIGAFFDINFTNNTKIIHYTNNESFGLSVTKGQPQFKMPYETFASQMSNYQQV